MSKIKFATGNPFKLPERSEPDRNHFDLRAHAVSAWMEQLPLTDQIETAQVIDDTLSLVNLFDYPIDQRMLAMKQLAEPLHSIISDSLKTAASYSLPLSEKALDSVNRLESLLTQIINSYKIALCGIEQLHKSIQAKFFCAACQGILHYSAQVLTLYRLLYARPPKMVWSDVYLIYQFARNNGFAKNSLVTIPGTAFKVTIEHLFKRILLGALVNPCRLQRPDMNLVTQYAGDWVKYIKLAETLDSTQYLPFAIHLKSDFAPTRLAQAEKIEIQDSDLLFINIDRLANHLLKEMAAEPNPNDLTQVLFPNKPLLKRLVANWAKSVKRRFNRAPSHSQVNTTIGLDITHHTILKNQAKSINNIPDLDNFDMESLLLEEKNEFLTLQHSLAQEKNAQASDDTQHATHAALQPNPVQAFTGKSKRNVAAPTLRVKDVSAKGYCLFSESQLPASVQIGDAIGIQNTSQVRDTSQKNDKQKNENVWSIGVVRWMQYQIDVGLTLGVELLAPKAVALKSRRLRANSFEAEGMALGLPGIKAVEEAATLLLPSAKYESGDTLIVNNGRNLLKIQLTTQLEKTRGFDRYEYKIVHSKALDDDSEMLNPDPGLSQAG